MRKDQKKLQVALALKLVVQSDDTVMIPVGEVPVLIGPDEGIGERDYLREVGRWVPVLATATNFIRCGCPEVRIWSAYAQELEHDKDRAFDVQTKKFEALEKQIKRSLSVFGPPYCDVDVRHGGGVIIIARRQNE